MRASVRVCVRARACVRACECVYYNVAAAVFNLVCVCVCVSKPSKAEVSSVRQAVLSATLNTVPCCVRVFLTGPTALQSR